MIGIRGFSTFWKYKIPLQSDGAHLLTNLFQTVVFLCRKGDLSCVRVLLEACPESIHSTDFRLQNCLHFAASHGHFSVVKYLLDQGAAVDSR